MQFTKAEDYGLHGVIFLAEQPAGKVTPLSEISEAQKVPEKFLAKIFQNLTKAGLIKSHRGVKGGFAMARPADKITVREVLESIQGPYYFIKCLEDESACDRVETCSIRKLIGLAQEKVLILFEEYTIADLASWEKRMSA
jgi:Rrf2 family iron-sulfur cluster assembly transcriptional regulator